MQVSTLTVKPDHVQVSLTENLLSFLGLFPSFDSLFVCYFFGVFLSLFPTFSVPLLHGHVDMALDHLFVFVSTSPRYFFQRAFVFHLPCFFCCVVSFVLTFSFYLYVRRFVLCWRSCFSSYCALSFVYGEL